MFRFKMLIMHVIRWILILIDDDVKKLWIFLVGWFVWICYPSTNNSS